MLRSFFRYSGLFLLWTTLGAVSYLLVTALLEKKFEVTDTPGVSSNELIQIIEDRQLNATTVVFARSEAPVDLVFDRLGVGYLLDKNGIISRIDPANTGVNASGHAQVEYLSIANEKTDPSVAFSSLVFHPGFLDSESKGYGCFYAVVPETKGTAKADFIPEFAGSTEHHQDVLVEFKTDDPIAPVFSGERRELMRLSQPGADHNMSGLAFDHRGNLFVAIGDGAAAEVGKGSPSRNAMSLANPYGKILRIDPRGDNSTNGNYGLPKRNPLSVIDSALPEIWCYGLRSPRALHYDPFREWLCIGDSGKENIEEVNISTYGGEHFGWDLCEGSFFFPPSEGVRPTEGVTAPQIEFPRTSSDTVAGGFIYRGERFPILAGKVIVATTDGRLMAGKARPDEAASELTVLCDSGEKNAEGSFTATVTAIRPGPGGEIFILSSGGNVYELHKPVNAATSKRRRKPLLASN